MGLKLARLAAILAIAAMPTLASAQFKLDSRYTDADGDMVADTPTERRRTGSIQPPSCSPIRRPRTPRSMPRSGKGFLDHLAKVTGKKVRVLSGAVERCTARNHAGRAAARHRLSTPERQSPRGGLRGLRSVRDDGV